MTSRERVRNAMMHLPVDRIPAHFQSTKSVCEKLMKYYGYSDFEQLLLKFEIDIRNINNPKYIGPELPVYTDDDGGEVVTSFWGNRYKKHWTGQDYNDINCYYPLDELDTIEEIDNYPWPSPDQFDYSVVTEFCQSHKDKAIMIGQFGIFQFATKMRSMDKLFVDMALQPEYAQKIFDRMLAFELQYYERMLIAGKGQVDILRVHDDYGTQISLLFSVDMWRQFFKKNTRAMADLAHKYGAFYQQHSCGAVRDIIPELIDCGVDALEPLQKVKGLEPSAIKEKFGREICFQGGIDTQGLLPFGTVDEVAAETELYINTLGKDSGYVLMASQDFEADVPVENIEALYAVSRVLSQQEERPLLR